MRLAEQRHQRAGSAPRCKKRLSTEAEDAMAQWLAQVTMTCRHRQRGCWRALLPAELDMISGIPGKQAPESPTAVEPCASSQGEVAPPTLVIFGLCWPPLVERTRRPLSRSRLTGSLLRLEAAPWAEPITVTILILTSGALFFMFLSGSAMSRFLHEPL